MTTNILHWVRFSKIHDLVQCVSKSSISKASFALTEPGIFKFDCIIAEGYRSFTEGKKST
jgi:hypothetical protein